MICVSACVYTRLALTSLLYNCFTLQEVAESVKKDFGTIDILVHSLANGPEV